MRVQLAIIFSLLCGPALADGAPSPAPQAPQPVTLPAALSGIPECRQDYAKDDLAKLSGETATAISFYIGVDGLVTDPALVKSSGADILDKAALACAAHWRYKPATLNGAPVSMTWRVWLGWHAASETEAVTQADDKPPPALATDADTGRLHLCANNYPVISIRLGEEGTTLMGFHVLRDGSTSQFTINKSSGSRRLDLASAVCVSRWRYKPPVKDDKPAEVPWLANVVWKIPQPLPPQPIGDGSSAPIVPRAAKH